MRRNTVFALGGTAGALVLILLVEVVSGMAMMARIDAPARIAPQAAARAAAAGDTGATPEQIDAWVQTALNRPLMSSTRTKAESPDGQGIALANGLPRLAGTLFTDAGGVAIFARGDDGKPMIAKQGGLLGPYRIIRIEPNVVTVDGPGGEQKLHPRFDSAAAAPAGPGFPGAFNGGQPVTPYVPQPLNMPGVMPPQFQPRDGGDQ